MKRRFRQNKVAAAWSNILCLSKKKTRILAFATMTGIHAPLRPSPHAGPGGASGNALPGMVVVCVGVLPSRSPNTISVIQFTSKEV